jgi:hypothetical protein
MRNRSYKFVPIALGIAVLTGTALLAAGILSTPRDYSSPHATIKVVDGKGAPIAGLEVTRDWNDSDCNKDGHDETLTDRNGDSEFSKVPASVGFFTGAWRKIYGNLGMCSLGNGTETKISVRFAGRYHVKPKEKILHPGGQSFQDSDGVWLLVATDSQSNTLAELTFPKNAKTVNLC